MSFKALFRACLMLVLGGVLLAGPALSQVSKEPSSRDHFVPSLGDLMGATQWRHLKLWFAGRLQNWELASYELGEIRATVRDAAMLYPGIPATDITAMADPIRALEDAIARKDEVRFTDGFKDLTTACNSCHQMIGRGFIVIQVPTSNPFANQVFAPGKP